MNTEEQLRAEWQHRDPENMREQSERLARESKPVTTSELDAAALKAGGLSGKRSRVIKAADLQPTDAPIAMLPDGYALIDPTPDELCILHIYADEITRLKPDEIIAVCQDREPGEIKPVHIAGAWRHFKAGEPMPTDSADATPEARTERWELVRASDGTSAATVWTNGVWHTWDTSGTGGENSSSPTVEAARREAALSAARQGFI